MRVPNEGESSFAAGRVGDGARGRSAAGGATVRRIGLIGLAGHATCRPQCRIRTQIRAAAIPGAVGEDIRIRQGHRTVARNIAEGINLKWLVVILAPLEIVDCRGSTSVVAVSIRSTGKLGQRVSRSWVVAVWTPVQAPSRPVENAVHRHSGSCGRREQERPGEAVSRVALADDQVSVASQDAHMVAVLVAGMLPAPLPQDPQQYLFTRVHVRASVV